MTQSRKGGEAIAEGLRDCQARAIAGGAPRAVGRAQQFEIEEPSREESQP